jgi:hypothetical protein
LADDPQRPRSHGQKSQRPHDLKAFATKEDLKEGLAATLADYKQYTRALFEDLKGDIGLLAEHLVQVSQKIDDLRPR